MRHEDYYNIVYASMTRNGATPHAVHDAVRCFTRFMPWYSAAETLDAIGLY